MPQKTSDLLRSKSRGNPEQVIAFLKANGAKRLDEAIACVRETYRLCGIIGLDASIAIGRMGDETGSKTGQAVFVSDIWATRLLNGGQGVTDTKDYGYKFPNGTVAAQAFIVHLALYAIPAGDPVWEKLDPYIELDPRFDAVPRSNRGRCKTLADLEGLWFTKKGGAQNSANRANTIYGGTLPDQVNNNGPEGKPVRPKVVIDAGHRSTDRTGNPAEMALTDDLARAYKLAFRQAGYTAYFYQEDLDFDGDPDETVGNLSTVTNGIRRWMDTQDGPLLLVSCHYNGEHSPVHVLTAEVDGLRSGYADGRPADDTTAVNTLDVALAAQIAQNFRAAGLGSLYGPVNGLPVGIMPETKSGVGLGGDRLGLFGGTAKHRKKAVRLIVEHGGTADTAAKRLDFTEKSAGAVVAAVHKVYGVQNVPTKPVDSFPTKRVAVGGSVKPKTWEGYALTVPASSRWLCTHGTTGRTAPNRNATALQVFARHRKFTFHYEATIDGETWLVSKSGTCALKKNFVATR